MSRLALMLLLVLGPTGPAWADIYAYTAEDGTVLLSNVPADDRYTVLIASQERPLLAGRAGPTVALPHGRDNPPAGGARVEYADIIEQVARASGVESALLHAVISVESRYNASAVSKKGAVGLMQLMPGTAQRYGVTDVFDPLQNLQGGARYLKDLLRLFGSDLELTLAAYNAGEQAVLKHGRRIPPYDETKRYVPLVLDFYRRYQAASAPT